MSDTRGVCLAAVVACSAALSWLTMQAMHEGGHVLHAWLSGGSVARVFLDPLEISHTELGSNPQPLFVAWGGVSWGAALPAVLLLLTPRLRPQVRQLGQFFVGFCLVANGAYLVGGTITRVGDPADLIRLGAPALLLLLVGGAMGATGLQVWHRLGPKMGFSVHTGPVVCRTAAVLGSLLALLVCAERVAVSQ